MNDLTPLYQIKPAAGPVIEFEPVRPRNRGIWQVVTFARTALLVWGGISLAGVAGAAAIYGADGLSPYRPAAEPIATVALPAPAQAGVSAKPVPHAAVIASIAPARPAPERASSPAQGLAALAERQAAMAAPASTGAASVPFIIEIPPPEPARLPRARPEPDSDAELTIASIERQHEFPRRFRTLREFHRYYPSADPFRMMRPRHAQRRAPRVYYRW